MSKFKKKLIIADVILIFLSLISEILIKNLPPTPEGGFAAIFTWDFVYTMFIVYNFIYLSCHSEFFFEGNSLVVHG